MTSAGTRVVAVQLALLTREFRIDRRARPATLTLIQRWEGDRGTQSDTSRSLLATLAPLTYRGSQQGVTYDLTFGKDRITGTQAIGDSAARPFRLDLAVPAYNEIVDDAIERAQPLAAGFVVRFWAVNPGEPARLITARVTDAQRLRLADGTRVDNWVVTHLGVRDFVVTWWVAKDTREEVEMHIAEPDGSEVWRVRLYTQRSVGHR